MIVLVLVTKGSEEMRGKMKFFITWVIAWLVFLFVFEKIPAQSPTRFTEMAPHIPLGMLVAYLFYELYKRAKDILPVGRQRKLRSVFKLSRGTSTSSSISPLPLAGEAGLNFVGSPAGFIPKLFIVLPIVIILFGMGTMSSSYMWLQDFVDHKLRATIPLVPSGADVMYPLYDIIDGITWLEVNTPRSDIILSGQTTGNYIPVYSGNTVFVGHANTVDLEDKMAAVGNFYVRHLPLNEELAWLKSINVSYIFYGPEEQEIAGGLPDLRTLYPMLTQVFENKTVRIYKTP